MTRIRVLSVAAGAVLAAYGGAAAAAPVAKPLPTFTYKCTPAMPLVVKYDNAAGINGQAVVTLGSKTFTLDQAGSASGARYETRAGRSPGATLIWWNKGRGGTLYEGSAADPKAAEKPIATCTQAG
ncbi:hypothetical protein GCM10011529_24460 [Polymorphobacter glacialis]|uniref:C-type lysozyme inhibitor domain-containing protein n=1 Tax=Sandarakinorhabdus glacialis TaxID=1614636 RepID=A0A916ZYL3_9SPHN|nr:MliC family protein [Polymorphobacter glacialis]GGE17100.1 hypothetical protein GCM10011529_24460 [Polymorphobacter glacialis]